MSTRDVGRSASAIFKVDDDKASIGVVETDELVLSRANWVKADGAEDLKILSQFHRQCLICTMASPTPKPMK